MTTNNTDTKLEAWWIECNGIGTAACPKCRPPRICSWHQARLEDLKGIILADRQAQNPQSNYYIRYGAPNIVAEGKLGVDFFIEALIKPKISQVDDELRFSIMDYLDEHDDECNADSSRGIMKLILADRQAQKIARVSDKNVGDLKLTDARLEKQLSNDLKHTLKLVPSSQRELFVSELARYLITDRQAQKAQQERAVLEARIDQVNSDFLDYNLELSNDESELQQIRDDQLQALQQTNKEEDNHE